MYSPAGRIARRRSHGESSLARVWASVIFAHSLTSARPSPNRGMERALRVRTRSEASWVLRRVWADRPGQECRGGALG